MEKIAEYYLGRFKSVVSDTNKLALLFLFTLFYVWYKSVNPAFDFLENIVTSKKQSIYFDSVYQPLNQSYTSDLRVLYKEKRIDLEKRLDSVTGWGNLNRYKYSTKDTFLASDPAFRRIVTRRQSSYNTSVLHVKHIRDSITSKLQDSLRKYQIEIDIPTLKTIDVELNIGIPIWMSLAAFFIVFMFLRRNAAFNYLHKSLHVYSSDTGDQTYLEHLDAYIPFWMHPYRITPKQLNGRNVQQLIQDQQPVFKTVLVICLISILLFIQFRTAILIWNKHSLWLQYQLFEPAYMSRGICFFMLAVSVVAAVIWLIPKKIDIVNPAVEHVLDSSRRKFIAAGTAIFLMQFFKPSYLWLDIKAKPFNYRRKKPVKENGNVLVPSLSGFYLNSRKKYTTMHYFDENGKNVMFKTIKNNRPSFISNLKKVEIFDYFKEIKEGRIHFPHSVWALENAATQKIKNEDFHEGLLLLQNGIEINIYNESRVRLTARFKKELTAAAHRLSGDDKRQFKTFLSATEKKVKEVKDYIRSSGKG